MPAKFFDEQREQSEVKARIVQKYFSTWARIVVGAANTHGEGKIAYIDLYAGPGRYQDGALSTPLLVLQSAIEHEAISKALVSLFNDLDRDNTDSLRREIDALPGINKLRHKPEVMCGAVDEDAADYFEKTRLIPAFTFFDPFGYKGLSLRLINAVIKDWGCDCIFFFNYSRINAGVNNDAVKPHMEALFGNDVLDELRELVIGQSPERRVELVLDYLARALANSGKRYVLPFRFRNDGGRLTHCLIFVTKHFKGYRVMKDIMAKESSAADQGVASFQYSPADESMPFLFELTRPLDDLPKMLLRDFAGRTVTFDELFEAHSVGKPFVEKNYKDVLCEMEEMKLVSVFDPAGKNRRKNTFANRLVVTFPGEGTSNDDVIED